MRIFAVALSLVAFGPLSANAIPLSNLQFPLTPMSAGATHTVTHDLRPLIPEVYRAVDGYLALGFADDSSDDPSEWATVNLAFDSFGYEVDGSIWSFNWELLGLSANARADLNADGLLSVTVNATSGDFYWMTSWLNVLAEPITVGPVKVPEPGTFALFAAGLLAIAFLSRRRATPPR